MHDTWAMSIDICTLDVVNSLVGNTNLIIIIMDCGTFFFRVSRCTMHVICWVDRKSIKWQILDLRTFDLVLTTKDKWKIIMWRNVAIWQNAIHHRENWEEKFKRETVQCTCEYERREKHISRKDKLSFCIFLFVPCLAFGVKRIFFVSHSHLFTFYPSSLSAASANKHYRRSK